MEQKSFGSIEEAVDSMYLNGEVYYAYESPYPLLVPSRSADLGNRGSMRILGWSKEAEDRKPQDENFPRVVVYNPNGKTTSPSAVVLQVNGYMQTPTAMMTEEVLGEKCVEVAQGEGVEYWGYAHGGRGKETYNERIGNHSVGDILKQVETELKLVFESQLGESKVILDGHSQGGQIVAHILKDPERFGLTREQISGAILRNSIPIPDSTSSWLTRNMVPSALKNLKKILSASIKGQGVEFNAKQAMDFFFKKGAEKTDPRVAGIVRNLYRGEGLFFLQSLLSLKGTSPFFDEKELKGTKIAVIGCSQDPLFPPHLQKSTANYLKGQAGADVRYFEVEGGGHYGSILGGEQANELNAGALRWMINGQVSRIVG